MDQIGWVVGIVLLSIFLVILLIRLFASSGSGKQQIVQESTAPAVSNTVQSSGWTAGKILIALLIGAFVIAALSFGVASPEGQVTAAVAIQGTISAVVNAVIVIVALALATLVVMSCVRK